MKVKFSTSFDEVLPEHADNQGKVFTLLGINHGVALCENEDGDKWFLPCDYIETYYGE